MAGLKQIEFNQEHFFIKNICMVDWSFSKEDYLS